MFIVVVIIGFFIFWLGNQNQKHKPDYIRDDEFIYEYLFPFALPSEAIKTIIVLKVSQDKISISWDGEIIYFKINKIINDSFHKQYECFNSHNGYTLITMFRGGVRLQDFQTGTDLKFTKTPPNPNY